MLPPDDAWLGHRIYAGKTGSGKTNKALNDMMEVVYGGRHSLVFVAPHEKAAVDFVSELYAQFGEEILSRLVVEQLGDTDKVIPRQFIFKSDASDYWTQRMENDAAAEAVISLMAARRKMTDFFERPSLEEISHLAIQLYQYQDTWWPEHLLAQTLFPKNPISKFAIEHCTDEEVKARFKDKIDVPPSVAETSTKPVARMLEQLFSNPAMKCRTSVPQTWDKIAFHNNAGIFIIVANGCSADALRTYTFSEFHQISAWARGGIIGPVVFVVDEVANYQLAGSFEAKSFATLRGSNVSIWYIIQSTNFPTEDITEAILDNSDHIIFLQGSAKMSRLFAEDLLAVLDEYAVHHTTVQQLHDGFDSKPRITSSTNKTKRGEETSEGFTEAHSDQLIPKYKHEEVKHYKAANDQIVWLAQQLQSLPRGTYYYKTSRHGAGKGQAQLFRDSWAFPGLKEAKYLECLQKLKTSAIYQAPTRTPFQPPTDGPQQTPMQRNAKKPR